MMTDEEYIAILKQDVSLTLADDDEFVSALLDSCGNVKEKDDEH